LCNAWIGAKNNKKGGMPMAMDMHEYGSELVLDLLDAANGLEHLTPSEIQELLRDAAGALCELTNPGCPSEARQAGCPRTGAVIVSINQGRRPKLDH
jgi:hypothetical protein